MLLSFAMNDLAEKVVRIVSESLLINSNKVNLHSLLIAELGADSLDFLDILFQIEEAFSIKLEKEDFDFLKRISIPREDAVHNGLLSLDAKKLLVNYLPTLEVDSEVKPSDLGQYLSVQSILKLVEEKLSSPPHEQV